MPPAKDISGNRYGLLVAKDYAYTNERKERVWRCVCDCGNEAFVPRPSLTKGLTRSCGCLLTKTRRRKKKELIPNCTCEQCGKEYYSIRSKINRCKHHFCSKECWYKHIREHPEANSNYKNRDAVTKFFASKIVRLRTSARSRNIYFSKELTIDYLVELWEKQHGKCFYSGIPLSFDANDTVCLVSVDRIDNSKGYEPGNIVLCCYALNVFKFSYPKEELERLITLIRKYGGTDKNQ